MVLLVVLALTFGARAQQSQTSATPSPVWNDNSLIALQKETETLRFAGDVKIEFYGHDAFKITSPEGLTVLTDPWRNDSTGVYPMWFLNEFPRSPGRHRTFDSRPFRPRRRRAAERTDRSRALGWAV